ncbi:MAG: hypothetical protein QW648_02995, partial [Nanoarchaeales archaeon]
MEISDFLNILLVFLIISFSIIITLRLAFLNMKYIISLNPFAIYQIAVSINYLSSNIGNFTTTIITPGMELVEYRISSYSEGILGYRPAYVSSGVCSLKDHLQELAYDAINAIMYTFAGGVFAGVGGASSAVEAIKMFTKIALTEAIRIYITSKITEGISFLISL